MPNTVFDPESALFYTGSTGVIGIDLSGYASSDYITCALPAFPLASITQASSFIDFTSNADGDFVAGPTASVAFSASTVALLSGDSEFRFPISSLAAIDLTQVTGVRFRITATGNCTFRCLSIRAISANWAYAPLDINTLYDWASRPVPRNGAASPSSEFPTTAMSGQPAAFPIVWRADDPSGSADPRPIDVTATMTFEHGSLTTATAAGDSTSNIVAMYFREVPLDYNTMLDLDGTTQAALDIKGKQPDLDIAKYASRTQADLDIESQTGLDGDTMFDLERLPDYVSETWIEVRLKWGSGSSGTLTIKNYDGTGYTFSNIGLDTTQNASHEYFLTAALDGDTMQVTINRGDGIGQYLSSVFDTGKIVDPSLFKRIKGRFGWWAQLLDGDALIKSIEPRYTNFGEILTRPFYSNTPVAGAKLFVGATPDKELFETAGSGPWGGDVNSDFTKTTTGTALRVDTTTPLDGLQTNAFHVDNWSETEIDFDIFFPASAVEVGATLEAFLMNDYGHLIPLNMPPSIQTDQWVQMRLRFSDPTLNSTGRYRLVVIQTGTTIATWWVDKISIRSRAIKWEGRSSRRDPWGMGNTEKWQRFLNTVNQDEGGVLFPVRGNALQVRGRALTQDVQIAEIKPQPKYAELGRLVWANDADTVAQLPTPIAMPSATFTTSPNGAAYTYTAGTKTYTPTGVTYTAINTVITFTATAVIPDGATVVEYYWDFGDGVTATGNGATHTYTAATPHCQAVLRITDSKNRVFYARKQMYLT